MIEELTKLKIEAKEFDLVNYYQLNQVTYMKYSHNKLQDKM